MAKYRYIYTTFWNDPRVVEEMTAEDKYFFLYLLTNESTTQIGIYQITKRQMAFDLGYSLESTNALLQRFTDHHKLIRYNAETREIAIKNWGKYNLSKGGKPIMDCVKKELALVKDLSLIEYVGSSVEKDDIRQLYESYYDTSTIRGQKEKEKEKEKEATPPLVDNSFIKIKTFFEQQIRPTTFRDAQDINKLLEFYLDADLIIEAMKIALDRGKPFINYIDGILNRWSTEQGINTYQDYLQKGDQSNASDRQPNGSNTSRTPEEMDMLAKLRTYSSTARTS